MPEVVIAIIILTVTGLTPFTGALALAIGGIGTHAKWTYETIEAVPTGTAEAVRGGPEQGTRLEVARWGLWTAAAPELMSLSLYRFGRSMSARRPSSVSSGLAAWETCSPATPNTASGRTSES